MQKTKRTVILSFLLCITMTLSAQRNEIFSSDIATLQVHNTQQLRAMLPVIQLNSGEQIQISFDNFRHEYRKRHDGFHVKHFDSRLCRHYTAFDYFIYSLQDQIYGNHQSGFYRNRDNQGYGRQYRADYNHPCHCGDRNCHL